MKVFVTGTSSFIGVELLRLCKSRGVEVSGIDLVENELPNCVVADICSPKISDHIPTGVDAVIHLAAVSRDPDCRDKALKCFESNVMGTLNLIEAAKGKAAKQFIFASSEWVYDNFQEGIPKTEEDPINIANHTSEYALSKLVSEANLRQKFEHGFCPTTILRFGIIYGPRKGNWSAVESIFNSVATQDTVSVGSLKTGRRFVHVSDIASGILAAVGLSGFEIINLQGNQMISLGDIINVSKEITKKNPSVTEKNPGQVSLRTVSNEKAKKIIGWEAKIDLKEGLQSVHEHLR